MKPNYKEETIKVSDIYLDQSNPRFPPVNSQREAIQVMLEDQGDKIITLASDIYQNGLNPSSKLILFMEANKYVDGDGNRRLTALKILETPSLADSEPRIRKKFDAILKENGAIPTELSCVIFKTRDDARHWISINHSGEQEGRGQISWNTEQKDRFEGKSTVGLEALDLLSHRSLITHQDKSRVNKTTLDRLLNYKDVKSKLSIAKNGEHFSFGDIESLQKTVLALRDKKVDEVYTAEKGVAFVESVLAVGSVYANPKSDEGNNPGIEDGAHTGGQPDFLSDGDARSQPDSENQADSGNVGYKGAQTSARSRRQGRIGLAVFGGALSLKVGHINNLYRDIELLYDTYSTRKIIFSDDFIVIFRMSLRMLAETAARETSKDLKDYLTHNFDQAKSRLDQNTKTSLSSQSIEKNKIVQLFQTGAHDYHNSRNEEQALALSIILGSMLIITHGKAS